MKNIILFLGMLMFLISLTSSVENIHFIKPPNPITDLEGTLVAGGSLTDGVTYYYTVLANGDGVLDCHVGWYGAGCTRSGKSNEISFTANATHKTVNLNWSVMGNATSYLVYRATLQGRYDTISTRMASETSGSGWNPSTLDNNFTDDGTHSMKGAYTSIFNKPTAMYAGGLNLSANGTGCLNISSTTDITLKEIYDASVADGWTDWCSYDGGHLVLAGDFPMATEELHFSCLGEVITLYGWGRFKSTNANSEIKFGKLSDGFTSRGCTINMLGGGGGATQVDFDIETLVYDTNVMGAAYTNDYYGGTYIHGGQYVNVNGGIQKDVKLQGYTSLFVRNDYPVNGLEITSYLASVYNDLTLTKNIKTSQYHWDYYSSVSRLDRFTATNPNFQTYIYYSLGSPKHAIYVDPSFPNTKDSDGLPVNYWVSGAGQYTEVWHSIKLKVIDNNGNALSNSNITINQLNGSLAKDFDGTEIENFETDSDGRLWREKIDITGNTTNTITDSSKSWGANEWKGRNVYIINGTGARQEMKVLSNTADTLTFTEDFVTSAEVGSIAGIIIEMKRARMSHVGSANCYATTIDCVNKTFETPHTITIDTDDYITKEIVYDLNKPSDLTITLEQPIFNYIAIQDNAKQSLVIK